MCLGERGADGRALGPAEVFRSKSSSAALVGFPLDPPTTMGNPVYGATGRKGPEIMNGLGLGVWNTSRESLARCCWECKSSSTKWSKLHLVACAIQTKVEDGRDMLFHGKQSQASRRYIPSW
jgi:hypothetical protein